MPALLLDKRKKLAATGMVAIFTLCAVPLSAQRQSADDDNTHMSALKRCRSEPDPALRLACYDAASEALITAEQEGDLRVVDREEVRKTRRSLFGLSLPDLGIFGTKDRTDTDDRDEIKEIETTIASVGGSHSTGYVIHTAEGAVWRIKDVPNRLLEPEVGDKLLIRSGALSSYFIRINKQGGVRASRIR